MGAAQHLVCLLRQAPGTPLFPYTTLFRSGDWAASSPWVMQTMGTTERIQGVGRRLAQYIESEFGYYALYVPPGTRSEEHTSELQSLRHLVCRLLLEKKK